MGLAAVQQSAWSYVLDEPTRILVADDDPILREFACVQLSAPVATIETVADGASALSLLSGSRFDIALLDIEMPSLDGFSLLERIRAEPKLCHLPVIMLTGHEDIASIDRAFRLGANSFVTKPVNWRLLNYHVRYVLRTSRVEQELRKANRRAEAKDAEHNRALPAFEVECHDVLRSILYHARRPSGEDALPESGKGPVGVQRIAELAAAALDRWAGVSGATPGRAAAAAPGAGEIEIGRGARCSRMR